MPVGTPVRDFDGTLTRHDFFRLALDRLLPPGVPDHWQEYRAGRLTHFEAMRRYYASIRASEALNASTGGQGLDLANPVQRAWRDANAVGRHISMNWDAVGTMYGQLALGLSPQGQY